MADTAFLSERVHPRRSAALSIAVVGLVYLATLAILEHRAFWITDNANKFLQMQAIVGSGYTESAIPWPGREIDPELTYNPLPPPFSHVHDGKLYSQYSPVFATISSVPFRWFGFPGLYLLPVIGSLAALGAVARIARQLGPGSALAPHLAVLLTGLCTPVWFYSVVFWEHTLALGLALWALVAVLRFRESGSGRALAGAAALVAISVYFRDDLALLSAALAVMAIASRPEKWWRVAAAWGTVTLLSLVPLALSQWLLTGDVFGFHVRSNLGTLVDHLRSRPTVLWRLFVAAHTNDGVSVLLTAPFLVALAWRPRFSERQFRAAVPVAALVALLAAAAHLSGLLASDRPVQWLIETNSLFPAAPLLLFGLMGIRRTEPNDAGGRIVLLAVAYACAYALLAPQISSVGIHWGNRFLLVVYPLVAVVAAARLAHWLRLPAGRPARLAVAAVVAVSVAAQLGSIHLLDRKKDFTYRLNQEVRSGSTGAVVTDTWWAAQEMFAEFYRRPVFLVTSESQLLRLGQRLRDNGHDGFLFVTPDPATLSNPAATVVSDGSLEYFSLALLPVRMQE